jgi:hypothetical protein
LGDGTIAQQKMARRRNLSTRNSLGVGDGECETKLFVYRDVAVRKGRGIGMAMLRSSGASRMLGLPLLFYFPNLRASFEAACATRWINPKQSKYSPN